MITVVFVCLGNICRSPMADGVFQQMVKDAGLEDQIRVDSCGTGGWHVGETAHRGTLGILKKHDIPYDGRSRQITRGDLQNADYLIAMDQSNYNNIQRLGVPKGTVKLLLEYAPAVPEREVPDPYYTGGFDYVYDLVKSGCEGLLADIRNTHGI